MKKILFVALLLCTTAAFGQRKTRNLNSAPEVIDPPRTGHAIGAVISSTNGNGLSYRYWPDKTGVHVTFFPSVSPNNKYISVGSTVYRTIREFNGNNKFFLHGGFDLVSRTRRFDYNGNMLSESGVNVGFGPGIESHSRYGSFSVYLGYGYYSIWEVMTLSGGLSYYFEI